MDPSQVSLVPKKEIAYNGQKALLDSSETVYPFFAKGSQEEKGRTVDVLLILDHADEAIDRATRCPYYPAMIGSCALTWPFEIGCMPMLEDWVQTERHEVFSPRSKGFIKGLQKEALILQSTGHSGGSNLKAPYTLGHRIFHHETSWGIFYIHGDFRPRRGYWEWAELILGRCREALEQAGIYKAVIASLVIYDYCRPLMRAFCESWSPATNSIHTSNGEMSISLWDLKELGSLPILGEFYDEVTPSFEEITGLDVQREPVLPRSCKFLFYAYHLVRTQSRDSDKQVSFSCWISWWFRGDIIYDDPWKADSPAQLRKMHLPSGPYVARYRSEAERTIFEELGVDSDLEDEVHLAAFLVTWLCTFVLPSNRGPYLRPETFKVASFMARGIRFCLATPVLASIYNGLNCIATCDKGPSVSRTWLPWHYVCAWIGTYFSAYKTPTSHLDHAPRMCRYSGRFAHLAFSDTAAREILQKGKHLWQPTRLSEVDDFHLVESPTQLLDDREFEFLVSIRTSYLTLRRGDFYLVEPYSPHRFARQFGYCQDLPRALLKDVRSATLRELVFLWKCSLYRYTPCRLRGLGYSQTEDKVCITKRFIRWWHGETEQYFKDSAVVLSLSSDKKFKVTLPQDGGHLNAGVRPLVEPAHGGVGGLVDEYAEDEAEIRPSSHSKRRKASEEYAKSPLKEKKSDEKSDPDSDRCNHRRHKKSLIVTSYPLDASQESKKASETRAKEMLPPKKPHSSKRQLLGRLSSVVVPVTHDEFSKSKESLVVPPTHDLVPPVALFQEDLQFNHGSHPTGPSMSIASVCDEGRIQRQSRELRASLVDKPSQLECLGQQPVCEDHDVDTASSLGDRLDIDMTDNRGAAMVQTPVVHCTTPATSFATYQPNKMADLVRNRAIAMMEETLIQKLHVTRYHEVLHVQEEASIVYADIRSLKGDPTTLQAIVDDYVAEVQAFLLMEKQTTGRLPSNKVLEERSKVEADLQLARSSFDALRREHEGCQQELEAVQRERVSLEESLRNLCERESSLKERLQSKLEAATAAKAEIDSSEEQLSRLDSTPTISEKQVKDIEELRNLLEQRRKGLTPSKSCK